MIDIINTIVPVFLVILVGIAIRKLGYLPEAQIGHLNRLVYYVAIPAMIFRAIATERQLYWVFYFHFPEKKWAHLYRTHFMETLGILVLP
jgi:hypothetical protein